jgi:chromosome partitioning protein
MIVLIGGEKGGTGKTTLATNLAACRAAAGHDVLLLDTDKQGSASFWAAVRAEADHLPRVACVQVFGKAVTGQLRDLSERYEEIIVDAGGRDSVELRAAMVTAHRLFIPLQASQFDVWTLERMDDLVEQAQAINQSLTVGAVINRASPHPRVREADEARGILDDFDHIHFSGVVLHDRIAFRRAASEGEGVHEARPPDPKACAEVDALYATVYDEAIHEDETAHAHA